MPGMNLYQLTLQEFEVDKQQRIQKIRDVQLWLLQQKLTTDDNMQRVKQFLCQLMQMRSNIEQEMNKLPHSRESLESTGRRYKMLQ